MLDKLWRHPVSWKDNLFLCLLPRFLVRHAIYGKSMRLDWAEKWKQNDRKPNVITTFNCIDVREDTALGNTTSAEAQGGRNVLVPYMVNFFHWCLFWQTRHCSTSFCLTVKVFLCPLWQVEWRAATNTCHCCTCKRQSIFYFSLKYKQWVWLDLCCGHGELRCSNWPHNWRLVRKVCLRIILKSAAPPWQIQCGSAWPTWIK